MQRNIEEITSELIQLPKRERLEIVRFLLFLDNHESSENSIETCWEQEITARIQAVKHGTTEGIDYDTAMKNLEKRLS